MRGPSAAGTSAAVAHRGRPADLPGVRGAAWFRYGFCGVPGGAYNGWSWYGFRPGPGWLPGAGAGAGADWGPCDHRGSWGSAKDGSLPSLFFASLGSCMAYSQHQPPSGLRTRFHPPPYPFAGHSTFTPAAQDAVEELAAWATRTSKKTSNDHSQHRAVPPYLLASMAACDGAWEAPASMREFIARAPLGEDADPVGPETRTRIAARARQTLLLDQALRHERQLAETPPRTILIEPSGRLQRTISDAQGIEVTPGVLVRVRGRRPGRRRRRQPGLRRARRRP